MTFSAGLGHRDKQNRLRLASICLTVLVLLALSVFPSAVPKAKAQGQQRSSVSVSVTGATFNLQNAPAIAAALLADRINLRANQRLVFLIIDLEEGWKTYWRLPGRFGIAPLMDWSASSNVREAEPYFPAPVLFSEADGQSIGYTDHTIWPILVTLADPGQGARLDLELEFGLCADICIPNQLTLSLALPSEEPEGSDAGGPVTNPDSPSMAELLSLASALPSTAEDQQLLVQLTNNQILIERLELPPTESLVVVESASGRYVSDVLTGSEEPIIQLDWPWEEDPVTVTLINPGTSGRVFPVNPTTD